MMTLRSWKGSTGRMWRLTLPYMGQMLMELYMTLWVDTSWVWLLLWIFISIDYCCLCVCWPDTPQMLRLIIVIFITALLILCYLLCSCRKSKSGTFAIWTPFWIPLNMRVASLLRESIHPTCILACGRPHLHGTLRTWTSTVSTTCTLESLNHGKDANYTFLDQLQI